MYNKVNMSITVKTNCMTSCLLNISEITIEKINIANSQYSSAAQSIPIISSR